jgi:hypothetical protein
MGAEISLTDSRVEMLTERLNDEKTEFQPE